MVDKLNNFSNLSNISQMKSDSLSDKLKRLDKDNKSSKFQNMVDDKLDSVKPKKDRPKDKKLWNACVDMESIFVSKMLKEMRKTVHKSEMLHGGQAEEIFEDMLYDEYAGDISKNSDLGIAKMMYSQLSRNI